MDQRTGLHGLPASLLLIYCCDNPSFCFGLVTAVVNYSILPFYVVVLLTRLSLGWQARAKVKFVCHMYTVFIKK